MVAYLDPGGGKEGAPTEIPAEMADLVAEHREKLLDAVVETDEALMRATSTARSFPPRTSRTP